MKRNALIVCDTTAPGGVDRYVVSLAHYGRKAGWNVFILIDDHQDTASLAESLTNGQFLFRQGPLHKRYDESLRRNLLNDTLTQFPADIVHVVLPAPWAGVVPRQIALERSIPLLATEQLVDVNFTFTPELRAQIINFYRSSIAHIAVSDNNFRILTEQFGFPADKLLVIPNNVNIDRWRPATEQKREAERKALNLSPEPLLFCPARLAPQKGLDVLLAALAHDALRSVAWHFYIAGIGPDEAALKQTAIELQIADRITWLGWRNDVARWLAAADVFVLPSRFEGQPFALLEAMASGVPVVATAVSGIPEALDNGRLGFMVEPENSAELATAIVAALKEGRPSQRCRDARSMIEARYNEQSNMNKTISYWDAGVRTSKI